MNTRKNKQIFNPYLPSYEYIPDGEPHIFGDRLYNSICRRYRMNPNLQYKE